MKGKRVAKALGLVLAIALIAFVCHDAASAQVQVRRLLGPCVPASGNAPDPLHCEVECVAYCTDFCSTITWTPASCQNQSGPCKRTVKTKANQVCRECTCTWPFGGCVDDGLYESGSRAVVDCQ